MISPSRSCAWEYFIHNIHSLLVGNTFRPPSTICLFATNYVFQAFVVHERPTGCIEPTLAFLKQLNKFDLRDAGSFSCIQSAEQVRRCMRWAKDRGTLDDSIRVYLCPLRLMWSVK